MSILFSRAVSNPLRVGADHPVTRGRRGAQLHNGDPSAGQNELPGCAGRILAQGPSHTRQSRMSAGAEASHPSFSLMATT